MVPQAAAAVGFAAVGLVRAGSPAGTDWLAAAGFGAFAGLGNICLFRGLSRGRASVVAPLSAIGAALVPALAGLARGERLTPAVLLALLLSVPAIGLLSSVPDEGPAHRGVLDGVLAGLGLGGGLAVLTGLSADAGALPLAAASLAAVVTVAIAASVRRERWRPRVRAGWAATGIGPVMVLGLGSFVLAVRSGPIVLVSVVSALYPAVTVLLAVTVLRERVSRAQTLGLVLAAVVLMAVAAG